MNRYWAGFACAGVLLLAARTGKHAIVEKPMALSLEHCDEMIAAFEQSGTALLVGHTHSFDPAIQLMREIIAGGEVSRLSMIAMANYTDFIYRPRRPEELDTSLGGGILFNQIPHQVDITRLLSGSEVRQVRATTGILDRNRPTEGSCMAMLSFEDGAAGQEEYFGVRTGHPNQLESRQEIDFFAHGIWRAWLPREAGGAHKIAIDLPDDGQINCAFASAFCPSGASQFETRRRSPNSQVPLPMP